MLGSRIDNVRIPAYGVRGGLSGRGGAVTINPETPTARSVAPLSDGTVVQREDLIRFETAGGGGWGHPYDRPAELVARDVRHGFVSLDGAREDYGVVLDPLALTVDARATARRRRSRPAAGLFHRGDYFD